MTLLLAPAERAFYMNPLMPPLSIGILNGYMRQEGIHTSIHDLNIDLKQRSGGRPREEWLFLFDKTVVFNYLDTGINEKADLIFTSLLRNVDIESTDIIGVSIGSNFSFFEIHAGFMLARYLVKKTAKPVVFGGDNIQYMYRFRDMFSELWQQIHRHFQYIFVGPGERSLMSLIHIMNGKESGRQYADLKGAIYFDGDELTANEQDVPTLCKPSYAGLDLEPYTLCLERKGPGKKQEASGYFHKWPFADALMLSDNNRFRLAEDAREESLFIPYIFNYNCPFKCAFCTQSSAEKKGVIAKKAEEVVDDIQSLMQEYGTWNFYFFNNTFNVNRAFVKEFCRIVKERRLEFYWSDCGRFNGLDKELLEMMYHAGCRRLMFGFESGSKKILKMIDKRLDLDHARHVLHWCKEIGIWADIEVILGFPYEGEEEFLETYGFIKENIKVLNGFHVNKYFVVPESLMGRYPERYGMTLIKRGHRYEKKLEYNAAQFLKASDARDDKQAAANFQMYHFEETSGRNYKQIITETQDKVKRLYQLKARLQTFQETQLNVMINKMNKRKQPKNNHQQTGNKTLNNIHKNALTKTSTEAVKDMTNV